MERTFFFLWIVVSCFFGIFVVDYVEGSFSAIDSTLPNLQAVGSTVTLSIQVTQTTGFATIQWKFGNDVVADVINNPVVSQFTYETKQTAYKPRLAVGATKLASNDRVVNTDLTFSNLSLLDSGIIITVTLAEGSGTTASSPVVLNVTVCPELQCVVLYDNLTSCSYNTFNCTSEINCCSGGSKFIATCQADATWDSNGQTCSEPTTTAAATTTMNNGIVTTDNGSLQGNNTGTTSGNDSSSARSTTISSVTDEATGGTVATSFELSPGAIAGIVIGTVVGVLLILFLIWWFSEAFRSCLHDISDCFPEDHCCGKGTC